MTERIEKSPHHFWMRTCGINTYAKVSDDARRLASVVYDHLDTLAEVGATRRARSSRLVPLAVRHLSDAAIRQGAEFQAEHDAPPAFRLKQLTVGPFRGFMAQEAFDLSHDLKLAGDPVQDSAISRHRLNQIS